MSGKHEPWNQQIASRIEALRIDVTGGTEPDLDSITASLKRYGFALLSGLSAERDNPADDLIELASCLGTVVPQSPRGEAVEDVKDFSDIDDKDDRGYRSGGELSPHADPPTLILLHCLVRAKSGGETYLVNVRAIHDRIADRSPELLQALFDGFPYWKVEGHQGKQKAGPAAEARSIFAERDGIISCTYYRPYIEMAARALGEPLTERQIAAMDLFDECAASPELALRFHLQPGQTILLHNRSVLHARTDYQDWPDFDRRRHLLRVWIDAPDLLPVAPEHELGDIFAPAS